MRDGSGGATRPSIPVVVWVAVGLWAGIALAEYLAFGNPGACPAPCRAAALVACACGSAILARLRIIGVVVAIAGLVVGAGLGTLSIADWRATSVALSERGGREMTAVVVGDAQRTRWGWSSTVRPLSSTGGDYTLDVTTDREVLDQGQRVRLRGRVETIEAGDEWERDAWREGSSGRLVPWCVETAGWESGLLGVLRSHRARLSCRLAELPEPGGALLRGMLLGDRRGLTDTAAESDFRISGLSHLLAVSGLHLGLVALGCGRALRACGANRLAQAGGVLCGALAFAALTGFQPSTVRALLMVVVAWIAALVGRRGDALAALAVSACLMLVARPMSAFSISFRLSVGAVGGLLLFGDLVGEWWRGLVPGWMSSGLSATLVAQATTLPVVASTFYVVSLVAPAANLVAIPVASLGLGVGLLGALLEIGAKGPGMALLRVAAALMDACARFSALFASIPHAAIAVDAPSPLALAVWMGGLMALWILWPSPRGRCHALAVWVASLVVVAVVVCSPTRAERLIVADVGQADAVILQDGGETMLVDCAGNASEIAAALGRFGVRRVDALILTHAHDDHTGGIDALMGTVTLGWVGVPAVEDDSQVSLRPETLARLTPRNEVSLRRLAAGDAWNVGRSRVTVLWPQDGPERETNDTSVVLLVERGGFSVLLGGDAEAGVWDELVDEGVLRDVDVLKVSHHGSSNGYSERALAVLRPELALISVGDGNRFGHPSVDTCRALEVIGAQTHRTDMEGDLVVQIEGSASLRTSPTSE